MKVLLIDTSYPINTRNERFEMSLAETFGKKNVKVVAWNRNNRPITHDYYIYEKYAQYGNKLAKLRELRGFRKLVKSVIDEFNPDIIIASHWDSLLVVSSIATKDTQIIYENLDMPTGKPLIRKMISTLEKFALRKVSCITFASRFYLPFYSDFKGQKFVIENKTPESIYKELSNVRNENLRICFLGALRYEDILGNAILAAKDLEGIEFHIYGSGPNETKLSEKFHNVKNLFWHGRYEYKDIADIYQQTDIIWAAYPSNDLNVKLAISNKYHESLLFNIPGIFSKDTKLGEMVENEKIGFVVDCYSKDNIRSLFKHIRDMEKSEINVIRDNLAQIHAIESKNWEIEIMPFLNYLKNLDSSI